MDKITTLSVEAISRYFHTLSVLGYKDYDSVYKLLSLLFVEELLTGELSIFINEEDYRTITNFLYCLYGSNCMIGFPSYNNVDSLIHPNKTPLIPRVTETQIIRISENDLVRKI
ncbi:hypothetical protein [Fusobacterium sp.]|uniref:hypothetical protein n=1 Tax=Fusobacterium sp. TaxID=68766 RepID=UPI002E783C01|nr:hypothetical protein [Fusobacterium sp.]MEE1476291.1 hypothetical protein [Fusobacterium sp.]